MIGRFLVLAIFSCASAFALYNGNPCFPEIPEEGFLLAKEAWMAMRMGYEGDFLFHRPMNAHVKSFKAFQNFGLVTCTFNERVEFYGGAGSSSFTLKRDVESNRISYKTRTGAAWKIGGRGVLLHNDSTMLTLHAAYLQTLPTIRRIHENGTPVSFHNLRLRYLEGEVSLGVSHQVDWFIPYAGVESSYSFAKVRGSPFSFHAHSKKPVGLFLGAGISNGVKGIVNVEARFIDELAVTVNADLKF